MPAVVEQVTPADAVAIERRLDRLARRVKDDALTQTLMRWVLRYRLEQRS